MKDFIDNDENVKKIRIQAQNKQLVIQSKIEAAKYNLNITTKNLAEQIPVNRWQNAVKKFKHALIPTSGDLVDSVRVRLNQDEYLREVSTKNFHGSNVEQFDFISRSENQVLYNKDTQSLTRANGKKISTQGDTSKQQKDLHAFVMAKDGSLYTAEHSGIFGMVSNVLTHGSFLSEKPVEMAGLLKINGQGKISYISSESGHYAPEPLDMYRGIKKLQTIMPEVFTDDAQIQYHAPNGISKIKKSVKDFLKEMETIGKNGKPLHMELRDKRIQEIDDYKKKLKESSSLVITLPEKAEIDEKNIVLALNDLPKKSIDYLLIALKKDNIVIKDNNDSLGDHMSLDRDLLVDGMIEANDPNPAKILLGAGISNYDNFKKSYPIYKTINQGNYEIASLILNDVNANKMLDFELQNGQFNSLEEAVKTKNIELINEILKHPAGNELIYKKKHC